MSLLLRHTLRSIRGSIGQLIVIILTVTVVTAMFFVTLTIGGLFTNLQTSLKSRLGGDTDVTVSGKVFSEAKLTEFLDSYGYVEYTETYLQLAGLFRPDDGAESKVVLVEATDLSDFIARHGRELIVYDSYEYSYGYPEVWVGRSFAEENGVSAGDTVEIFIEMYGEYRVLTVTYIFENYGVFANSVVNNVLCSLTTVGNKGMLNLANIKLADGADKEEFAAALSEYLGSGVTVADSVDMEEVERIVSSNQSLLDVALVFVTALMVFILFTSFLVVAKKRARELAVFRTAGASNAQIAVMLLAEGLLYGFVGAFIGTLLGRIGMGIAVEKVIPNFPDAVRFTAWDYILSILFGAAVSVLSALVPVLSVSRESVRKASSRTAIAKKSSLLMLGISAVALTAAALLVAFLNSSVALTVVLVACAALFVYFAIPFVIRGVAALARGKGTLRLSGLSVKRNPTSRTLSGMAGFIIVFTFLSVSIVNVIIGAVTPYNSRFSADYVVESLTLSDLIEVRNSMSKIYGVVDANIYYYDTFVWETDTQTTEYTVYGAENSSALSGLGCVIDEETARRFDGELNPVVISYDLSRRFDISTGDVIKLRLSSDGEELYDEFTVVGIDYATTSDDRVMIIRASSFRVGGLPYATSKSMVFINTDKDVPNADLYKDLREIAEESSCYILKFDDWAYATSVGIKGVVTLLEILLVLIIAVALIGIANLTVVTLYGRRREMNVFRAAGLNKGGFIKLSFFESLIIALSGAVVGVLLSMIVNLLMPVFALIIDRYVVFEVFPPYLALIAAAGIVVSVAIYVGAAALRKNEAVERNLL